MQALIALKKGAQLLKYGRKGKPKFCPFRLSNVSFWLKNYFLVLNNTVPITKSLDFLDNLFVCFWYGMHFTSITI